MMTPKLESGKTSTVHISLDRITLIGVRIGVRTSLSTSGGVGDNASGWAYVLPITSLTSSRTGGTSATYGDIPMNGDVIECEVDRSAGTLSFRTFRDGRWKDNGVAFTSSGLSSGDLYFAVSVYEKGDTLSIVGKPIGK